MLNYILEYILHRKVVYRVVLRWLLFMGFSHFLPDPPCFMDIDSRRLMIWALPFSRMSSSWILVQTWALRGIRDGTLWLCGFTNDCVTLWLCDRSIIRLRGFTVSLESLYSDSTNSIGTWIQVANYPQVFSTKLRGKTYPFQIFRSTYIYDYLRHIHRDTNLFCEKQFIWT